MQGMEPPSPTKELEDGRAPDQEAGELDNESAPLVQQDGSNLGGSRSPGSDYTKRSWWQIPLLPLFHLHKWLSRLSEAFGSRFVFAVIIVYGISQGIGETVGAFSSNYFWKDVMRVSPAQSQVSRRIKQCQSHQYSI